jgi:hypothetical protein
MKVLKRSMSLLEYSSRPKLHVLLTVDCAAAVKAQDNNVTFNWHALVN